MSTNEIKEEMAMNLNPDKVRCLLGVVKEEEEHKMFHN